ncbi:MAG: 50S ribosomal protein L13 [Candidatus Diapherotrites archaeon]|nr:50S ribosomal protein L13 [Candidatus Diapherotrites archaeon]
MANKETKNKKIEVKETEKLQNRIFIDATGLVLGRMASLTAHKALRNMTIVIVNAEKAVLNGNTENLFKNYKTKLDLEAKGNPEKGPEMSKMPDAFVRRSIRGMLPYTSTRGQAAFRRVHVCIGFPKKYQGQKMEDWAQAKAKYSRKFIEIGEFCKLLGAKW